MKNFAAVLFDLDGTLLDTAPDLALALNTLLKKYKRNSLSLKQIRPLASKGTAGLLKLGFELENTDENYPALRQEFLDIYSTNIKSQTDFFPGIKEVIFHLEKNKIKWGIVTNKPQNLTHQLLKHFDVSSCACVVSGDTLTKQKPHPEPLWHACELLNSTIEETIFIGDDQRDIIAAKKANILSVAALYGYIAETDDPYSWEADYYINEPEEIITSLLLKKKA